MRLISLALLAVSVQCACKRWNVKSIDFGIWLILQCTLGDPFGAFVTTHCCACGEI